MGNNSSLGSKNGTNNRGATSTYVAPKPTEPAPIVYQPPAPIRSSFKMPSFYSRHQSTLLTSASSNQLTPFNRPLFPDTSNLRVLNYGSLPAQRDKITSTAEQSFSKWVDVYQSYKQKPDNLQSFQSRISKNVDENLQKRNELGRVTHQIHMTRIRETGKLFSDTESSKLSINSAIPIQGRLSELRALDSKYFPVEKKRPELTASMLEEIREASRPQPSNEVLVELDGVQILRKDIQTLLGLNWLNDEIVNAYMNLLVLRGAGKGYKRVYSFNTFFYPKLRESGYNSIKRWTRKVDIFSYDFILVPVHLGNHWCLAFIDFTKRTISYYDSLGGHPNGCCDTLLDYLRYESNDKKKQDFDDENWNLIDKYSEGIPTQRNCSDCGVFACTYAEYLTRQAKLSFGQEHMPYFRKKMIYEIIAKKILE